MAKRRSALWHVGQGIGYVTVRWLMAWMQIAGWRAAREFGRYLGILLYYVLGRRRATAMENLTAAKIATSPVHADWLTRAMFQNLGMMAAEVALIPILSRRRDVSREIALVHPEYMHDALRLGKGAIVSIGHLGNWETGSIGFCREIHKLHSVYRPLDYKPLDRLILRIRTSAGMGMIPNEEAIPRIVRILKGGGTVALLTDQDARSDGVFINFFGRLASTLPTPAVLSLRFGTPIVPVNVYRTTTQIVVRFDPMIRPEAFSGDPDPRKAITQEVARRGEKFIREHPAQWFWLHRRWKTRPT